MRTEPEPELQPEPERQRDDSPGPGPKQTELRSLRMRHAVIKEIIETEQRYVDCLSTLCRAYMKPIMARVNEPRKVSASVVLSANLPPTGCDSAIE